MSLNVRTPCCGWFTVITRFIVPYNVLHPSLQKTYSIEWYALCSVCVQPSTHPYKHTHRHAYLFLFRFRCVSMCAHPPCTSADLDHCVDVYQSECSSRPPQHLTVCWQLQFQPLKGGNSPQDTNYINKWGTTPISLLLKMAKNKCSKEDSPGKYMKSKNQIQKNEEILIYIYFLFCQSI